MHGIDYVVDWRRKTCIFVFWFFVEKRVVQKRTSNSSIDSDIVLNIIHFRHQLAVDRLDKFIGLSLDLFRSLCAFGL